MTGGHDHEGSPGRAHGAGPRAPFAPSDPTHPASGRASKRSRDDRYRLPDPAVGAPARWTTSTSRPSAGTHSTPPPCAACATCTTWKDTPPATCGTCSSPGPTATPRSRPSWPAGATRSTGTVRRIAEVLRAHDEPAGRSRLAAARRRLPRRDALRPVAFTLASALTPHIVAVHMTWGAVNEWTTQAGYGRLAAKAKHPVLSELLRRIMRQEGRHIDFYALGARQRLADSATARRLTRFALRRYWAPVGAGVMPDAEVKFLVEPPLRRRRGPGRGTTHRPRRRAAPRARGPAPGRVGRRRPDLDAARRPRVPAAIATIRTGTPTGKGATSCLLRSSGWTEWSSSSSSWPCCSEGTQIPKLARSLGSARSEFKKGLAEVHDTVLGRRSPARCAHRRSGLGPIRAEGSS